VSKVSEERKEEVIMNIEQGISNVEGGGKEESDDRKQKTEDRGQMMAETTFNKKLLQMLNGSRGRGLAAPTD
jgi:hypothetical protein